MAPGMEAQGGQGPGHWWQNLNCHNGQGWKSTLFLPSSLHPGLKKSFSAPCVLFTENVVKFSGLPLPMYGTSRTDRSSAFSLGREADCLPQPPKGGESRRASCSKILKSSKGSRRHLMLQVLTLDVSDDSSVCQAFCWRVEEDMTRPPIWLGANISGPLNSFLVKSTKQCIREAFKFQSSKCMYMYIYI